MRTTHRDYADELDDFNRLSAFFLDHYTDVRTYSTWCIGRFVDWKYGLYQPKTAVPDFCNRNAHLWFDGFQRLVGFVISENGDSGFAIITLPGYRFLFEEMLTWVLTSWADRGPTFSLEIRAIQTMETAVLTHHGFHKKAEFFTQRYDLTAELPPPAPLDDGFTIVDMAAHPDYRAQRLLRDNAFQGVASVSEADLQHELLFYNHSHRGPIYHPQTDLCVMAPDGRFVAGCEALIDAHNAEADIERVCTHSAFRRRGFAQAVIVACMARLQTMGMRAAYITGYSPGAIALYASLGSGQQTTGLIYETAVAPQPDPPSN